MFAQIEYPNNLLPEELDKYLAKGWFRMRQTIFTTNFLHFNHQFYSAIWLRVQLDHSIHDKKYLHLNKLNQGFQTEIKKAVIDAISPSHELLYQYYRQAISFDVSSTLQELLFGNESYNRFNTYEVNIYDGDLLIAVGFFDLGEKSAAGITSIYHPEYRKYSLGKYLVYLKMDYCRQRQLQYFYPGYAVPGYPSFDYKLEIGKATLQYLQLSTGQWLPYAGFITAANPLKNMCVKLEELHALLTKNKIHNTILYYKFFEVNLDSYYHSYELFDFPVFLICFSVAGTSVYNMTVYDVRDARYHLVQCSSIINIGFQQFDRKIFDSALLRVEKQLFVTAIPKEMGMYLSHFLK